METSSLWMLQPDTDWTNPDVFLWSTLKSFAYGQWQCISFYWIGITVPQISLTCSWNTGNRRCPLGWRPDIGFNKWSYHKLVVHITDFKGKKHTSIPALLSLFFFFWVSDLTHTLPRTSRKGFNKCNRCCWVWQGTKGPVLTVQCPSEYQNRGLQVYAAKPVNIDGSYISVHSEPVSVVDVSESSHGMMIKTPLHLPIPVIYELDSCLYLEIAVWSMVGVTLCLSLGDYWEKVCSYQCKEGHMTFLFKVLVRSTISVLLLLCICFGQIQVLGFWWSLLWQYPLPKYLGPCYFHHLALQLQQWLARCLAGYWVGWHCNFWPQGMWITYLK
jgi:hypothetical protein